MRIYASINAFVIEWSLVSSELQNSSSSLSLPLLWNRPHDYRTKRRRKTKANRRNTFVPNFRIISINWLWQHALNMIANKRAASCVKQCKKSKYLYYRIVARALVESLSLSLYAWNEHSITYLRSVLFRMIYMCHSPFLKTFMNIVKPNDVKNIENLYEKYMHGFDMRRYCYQSISHKAAINTAKRRGKESVEKWQQFYVFVFRSFIAP